MKMIFGSFFHFPTQIRLLLKSKKCAATGDEIYSINLLMLISLTSFLESVISDVLKNVISDLILYQEHKTSAKPLHVNEKIKLHMFKDFERAISNASFIQYDDICKRMLNEGLANFTCNDTWETIKILFVLRNQVVHGRDFTVSFIENENDKANIIIDSKYKSVVDYLLKKGILNEGFEESGLYEVISDKSVYHFHSAVESFFHDFNKHAHTSYAVHPRYEYLYDNITENSTALCEAIKTVGSA